MYDELVVPEYLEADTLGGNFSAEDDDTAEVEGNGIVTVEDGTGPAPRNVSETAFFGDRYLFRGDIEQLSLETPAGGSPNLYLDERPVDYSALPGNPTS